MPPEDSGSRSSDEDAWQMQEWQAAREVLKTFDDNLHDLRKYGFTFITALLTADSLLLPYQLIVGGSQQTLHDNVKLAVLTVTLLLIVALQVIDRNYQVFLEAAATRAVIIERRLNLELTQTISDRAGLAHLSRVTLLLYFLFTMGVSILGVAVLWPNYEMIIVLETGAAAALLASQVLFRQRPRNVGLFEDWTLSPLIVERGGKVKITVTNLERGKKPKPITFGAGKPVLTIVDQAGVPKDYVPPPTKDVLVRNFENYIWSWDSGKVEPGIYGVLPRGWARPLYRKVTVV
ncbi:MAG: hypothetical protein LYZ66_03835 [Nitrososphaerales archaeon]|nr:hypothetical protein [Nitrososphaerales archaeon]